MRSARLTIDPAFPIGAVDSRLFGTFVEHVGRCVYTGIFEPAHATADEHGFRGDVLELTRELGTTIVRYPGGNFVSGYDWEDGVGPRDARPRRLDLAWRQIESNEVGTDEFVRWAQLAGAQPMLAVNLGTRGVDAARALVEYCNHPAGSERSDERRRNGCPEPHNVRVWCLGNEMDGPWQLGRKTAIEYGRLAAEAGKAMKLVDPTIELVACGSSGRSMPTFGSWEASVLGECYDAVDYLSLHAYYDPEGEDLDSFLASGRDMDAFIDSVVATCDYVRARRRSDRRIDLAFDEWNVWYLSRFQDQPQGAWAERPRLIENLYTLADAVVVGSLLITLLRHADRVRIACLAQLVNAIAPIMTEPGGPAWRQTIFHPFALTAALARDGIVLRVEPEAPTLETTRHGAVPVLETTAVWHEDSGELTIFAVNRNTREPLDLDVRLRGLGDRVVAHTTLAGSAPEAANTAEHPGRVKPRSLASTRSARQRLRVTLPPLSWNVFRLMPPAS